MNIHRHDKYDQAFIEMIDIVIFVHPSPRKLANAMYFIISLAITQMSAVLALKRCIENNKQLDHVNFRLKE